MGFRQVKRGNKTCAYICICSHISKCRPPKFPLKIGMSGNVEFCACYISFHLRESPFLKNGGDPVGGAEVLLVVPLEHERARGATAPRSAATAFDQLFANTARNTASNIVEWIL